jgi:transcriptional regulator with XRE-family HTH domain
MDHLRKEGGLEGRDIVNIMAVSPATVSRWLNGKASPDLRSQTVLAQLRYVVDRFSESYTPDEAPMWLYAPHQMLGGDRAIDLISVGRTQEVLAVIE